MHFALIAVTLFVAFVLYAGRYAFAAMILAVVLSCAPRDDARERNTSDTVRQAPRALFHSAALVDAPAPTAGLENAPIVFTRFLRDADNITAVVVGDSLRVTVNWSQPADTLGNADSTSFRIRATKSLRLSNGNTVGPETWRRRVHTTALSDVFTLAKPAVGDSVIFRADSIRQCRKNACSVPGSAAWGYHRSAAPPAMTFVKVTVDSF